MSDQKPVSNNTYWRELEGEVFKYGMTPKGEMLPEGVEPMKKADWESENPDGKTGNTPPETRDYFVTRRCKTASGQLLERDRVYALTAAESEPLIENEILRLPKKGELAAAE